MPPEPTSPPPVPQEGTPPKKHNLFWLLIGLAAVIAIAGAAFAASYYLPKTQEIGMENTMSTLQLWTYEYQPLHMRMTIGEEWEEISTGSVALPQDIAGERFAFRKKGTSCVLAYVTAPEDAFQNYIDITKEMAEAGKITSPNILNRIYNSNLRTTFNITAHMPKGRASSLSEQYRAGGSNPSLTFHDGGIIFVSSHLIAFKDSSQQAPVFVLFDDGTDAPWDGYCLSDTVRVIEKIDRLYDPIMLSAQSEGALYITSEKVQGEEVDQVRFIPAGTGTAHTVVGLTATSRPMPQVVDGKLYIVIEGELRTLDPFNKTSSSVLDIRLAEDERIQAFIIEDDKVVYLAGKNCLEYMAKCDLALNEYDRTTQHSTQLAKNLPYRELVGYDRTTGEILLVYRDGDAGCSWGQIGIYSYSSKEIKGDQKYSACSDEERSEPPYATAQAEIKRFAKVMPTSDYALVADGKLLMPTQPLSNPEDMWTFAYPQ